MSHTDDNGFQTRFITAFRVGLYPAVERRFQKIHNRLAQILPDFLYGFALVQFVDNPGHAILREVGADDPVFLVDNFLNFGGGVLYSVSFIGQQWSDGTVGDIVI